jgi:hypothetical protein
MGPRYRIGFRPKEPKPTLREQASGCSYLSCVVASVLGAIVLFVVVVVTFFDFTDALGAWLLKVATLVGPRAVEVFFGVPLLAFGSWGIRRALTGRSAPELTPRQRIVGTALLAGIALLGLWLLVAAIVQPASARPT